MPRNTWSSPPSTSTLIRSIVAGCRRSTRRATRCRPAPWRRAAEASSAWASDELPAKRSCMKKSSFLRVLVDGQVLGGDERPHPVDAHGRRQQVVDPSGAPRRRTPARFPRRTGRRGWCSTRCWPRRRRRRRRVRGAPGPPASPGAPTGRRASATGRGAGRSSPPAACRPMWCGPRRARRRRRPRSGRRSTRARVSSTRRCSSSRRASMPGHGAGDVVDLAALLDHGVGHGPQLS